MKSFDSNDKSFEERFDPELRTIGDSQLQNHDQKKGQTPTSKFFRLEFSKSIPLETKTFLSEKLPDMLDFPGRLGLKINYASHLLRFIDQTTYETEIGSPLPKNVTLPASRIDSFIDSRS